MDGQKLYGEVTLDALKSKASLATDSNGVVIEGAGGSQTPWASDIDGGGYDLTGVTDIEAKDVTAEEVISGEMVANNSFDTDSLFTTQNGTINYSSGSYTFLASAIKKQDFSDMLIAPSSGVRRYKYEFVVSAASGTTRQFFPSYPNVGVNIGDPGTYTGEFDAEITDPFRFGTGGSGNASVTVDSISIKEITKGNVYADQRMYAQRFVTEGGTATQVVLGDGTFGSVLFLDQTTPQTVSNGAPNFAGGIQVSTNGGVLFSDGLASNYIQFDGTNFRFTSSLERNDFYNYDIGTIGNPWNNVYANYFVGDGSGLTGVAADFSSSTTDNLTEGSTNLYFNNRTLDDLADGGTYGRATLTQISNWDTAYGWGDWSGQGFITDLSTFTTDDLTEGSTNLYYTDGKVDTWLTNKGAYTGDLNDSTSTKIADVVEGLITAVYY